MNILIKDFIGKEAAPEADPGLGGARREAIDTALVGMRRAFQAYFGPHASEVVDQPNLAPLLGGLVSVPSPEVMLSTLPEMPVLTAQSPAEASFPQGGHVAVRAAVPDAYQRAA